MAVTAGRIPSDANRATVGDLRERKGSALEKLSQLELRVAVIKQMR